MIVLLHCRYGGQYSGFSSPTHFTGYPVAVSGTNTPPAAQQQIFTPPQQQQGQEAASLGPSVRQTVEEEVRGRLREEIGREGAAKDDEAEERKDGERRRRSQSPPPASLSVAVCLYARSGKKSRCHFVVNV